MSTIDRRSLFSLTAAALGGAALPDWLARALAIQEPVSTWRVKQLREAIARAKQANKPLLVMVAPAANDRDARGQWFGAWLHHPHDADLYLLSGCDLACATTDELATILGRPVTGSPLWVLVDAGSIGKPGAVVKATAIECGPPVVPQDNDRSKKQPKIEARETGLLAMHEALQAGVARHGLDLASFAAAAVRRLDDEQKRELDAWFASGKQPGRAFVALAAPEIWRRIGALPEGERKGPTVVLRSAIEECIVSAPVAGARWRRELSCINGEFEHPTNAEKKAREMAEAEARRVEDELAKHPEKTPTPEQLEALWAVGISMCGIGYVAPLSARFLEFWTAGE